MPAHAKSVNELHSFGGTAPWAFVQSASLVRQVVCALRRAKDTATGPVGVPYSAWRAAGRDGASVLCRVLSRAATNGRLPTAFCNSVAAFLPKGTEAHDDPG